MQYTVLNYYHVFTGGKTMWIVYYYMHIIIIIKSKLTLEIRFHHHLNSGIHVKEIVLLPEYDYQLFLARSRKCY